jgi:hypothetical protein
MKRQHDFGVCGALSIQRLEGSRFVRGGRYGISIDFGLEVVGKTGSCVAMPKSNISINRGSTITSS